MELLNNGIDIFYYFMVIDCDGMEVYYCFDYIKEGSENIYLQVLFKNDFLVCMVIVNIYFFILNSYIFSFVKFMILLLIFIFVLFVMFIFIIYIIFCQKKLIEIKNDFINNMIYEFKMFIFIILLVVQMLKDLVVGKFFVMFQYIFGVINDEIKCLCF